MSSPGGPGNQGPYDYGQSNYNPYSGQHSPGMSYQGFGVYDQNQPGGVPPRKNRAPLVIGIAVATVVLVGGIVAIGGVAGGWFSSGGDSRAAGAQSTSEPPSESSTSTETSETETSETETGDSGAVRPIVPGWQVASVPKRGAAYDIPSDWTLKKPSVLIGWGEGEPTVKMVAMTGAAAYQEGFCPENPNSHRAVTGSTGSPAPNDAEAAKKKAHEFATAAYTVNGRHPKIEMGAPEHVMLDQGSANGVLVTATVTHPQPGPCDAPKSLVNVLARGNDGSSSVVHVAMAEQGVPNALPPETLRKISLTFRPGQN